MDERFTHIQKRPTTVNIVIDAMKDSLIHGRLHPGDLLPNETSLAEQLNVSRGSVREAMKILGAYGIVDVRRGEGTYICSGPSEYMFNPILFQILVKDGDISSVVEVRRELEAIIIKMAINKATDDEIEQLKAQTQCFVRELENPDGINMEKASALDIQFHRLLAKMCKNVIVENIYNFIIDLFEPHINPAAANVKENHINLTQSIIDRDLEASMMWLNKHNDTWNDSL